MICIVLCFRFIRRLQGVQTHLLVFCSVLLVSVVGSALVFVGIVLVFVGCVLA
jgi:hypothetical protein